MLPTDDLAEHWAAEHGLPLSGLRAWGLPLVRDGRVLRSAGGGDLPAVRPDPAAPPPDLAAVPSDVGAIVLHDVADEGRFLDRVRREVPSARTVWRYACPVADVGDDVDAFLRGHLSSNRRKKQRRYLRDAEALGDVALRRVGAGDVDAALPHFRAMLCDRAVRSGRYDAALTAGEQQRRQWLALADGPLRISVLTVAGRPVSFRTGFVDGDRFVGYQPAIDREHDGIGHLHLELLLRELVAEGVRRYDFGKGTRSSKDVWATRSYDLHAVVIPTGRDAAARAAVAAALARQRARGTITARGWEHPLRRALHTALTAMPTPYRRAVEDCRAPQVPRLG